MPPNVINTGLCSYIERYQDHELLPDEISRILKKLNELVSNPLLTAENHLKSLYERHNSIKKCPQCGFKLVERIAKNGNEIGSKFLGCENYPECRFTKKVI
jgi:hypothetical protein